MFLLLSPAWRNLCAQLDYYAISLVELAVCREILHRDQAFGWASLRLLGMFYNLAKYRSYLVYVIR